ncbi:meprin A subunit alpha-like [Tiliqua scincoides]|uniref:meprin A subunit alpha-like n=1 Tax=Tiliqua scincoides TaxID=71010 RepID=UPI003461B675
MTSLQLLPAAGLNLFEGDIVLPRRRSAIRAERFRWKFPIPFILADDLDLNAKGVILRALEGFRLKTCVDFKSYNGEKSFIMFRKSKGCWSKIGDIKKGQNISIGEGCSKKAIVSHEILHALGFYHEQTRTDRDDYIKIWWNQVLPGEEHNFKKRGANRVTDLNTAYDYESIMHYGSFSFSKNRSLPTMTASIPKFNNIIGQRADFSTTDLERLNRMYNCTTSLTFLDHCDFESADICALVQETTDDSDWIHRKSSSKEKDHTHTGKCKGSGHFMYFNTTSGRRGKVAVLKSRIFSPKRTDQCLQFFFKMTGDPRDKLAIWMKQDDSTGKVRKLVKLRTFEGDDDQNWKIAHVVLKTTKKFRYIFQGIKGNSDISPGGISIDDITLSETKCPSGVWIIRNFSHILHTTAKKYTLRSPRFYSPEGYSYSISLFPRGQNQSPSASYIHISFNLLSGENDDVLEWPALHRQATVTVVDQTPNVREQMSLERSFTTNPNQFLPGKNGISRWGKPSAFGEFDPVCNCNRSRSWGWLKFISYAQLRQKNYLKNDDLIIFTEFEDLSYLRKTEHCFLSTELIKCNQSEERKKRATSLEARFPYLREQCDPNPCQNGGICISVRGKATCRCAASAVFFYMGMRCQIWYIQGNIIDLLAIGTIVLIAVVVFMLGKWFFRVLI